MTPQGSDALDCRPPLLFILSGPSGAGKDTIIRQLREGFTDIHYAVTTTTRPPRPGEVDGKSYFFVSNREYDKLLDRGELLAPAEVHGHRYGAPIVELRRAFARNQDVLLKIDVQGAMQVRRRIPQAVFIFLAPPSMEDLVARLEARHTESPSQLERRLHDARFEMDQMPQYDYVVVNRDDRPGEAVRAVGCIITAERLRTHHQPIDLQTVDARYSPGYTRLDT